MVPTSKGRYLWAETPAHAHATLEEPELLHAWLNRTEALPARLKGYATTLLRDRIRRKGEKTPSGQTALAKALVDMEATPADTGPAAPTGEALEADLPTVHNSGTGAPQLRSAQQDVPPAPATAAAEQRRPSVGRRRHSLPQPATDRGTLV